MHRGLAGSDKPSYQMIAPGDGRQGSSQAMSMNRGEVLEELDARRASLTYAVCVVAVLGFLVVTLEVELLWLNKNVPTLAMQLWKLLGSVLTLILFYLNLRAYSLRFEMLEVSGMTVSGASYVQAFVLSGLLTPFLIDAGICLIHPLPFVNYTITMWARGHYYYYSSDSFVCCLMMCRIYLLFPRFIAEVSGMKNERVRLVGLLNHVNVDTGFIFRHLLSNSLTVLLFTFLTALLTLSYAMVIFERPLGDDTNLDDYENAMWVIIITMTTVGYGDTYPKSPAGRGVAVIASFYAVVLLALAVNAVTQRLSLTRDQMKTLEFLQDIEAKQERKHLAAKVIQRGFEAYKRLKKDQMAAPDPLKPGKKRISAYPKFCAVAHQFHEKRSEGDSISTDVPLMVAENSVQIKRIDDNLRDMETKLTDMHNLLKMLAGGGARTMSTKF
mmetsp:Transcript_48189/g.73365  ORF Transcript_48189/g.73365 Transcript_48189/m.73365 type:complete len:441 (-) Transcript_48189:40-1362(-)